MTSLEDFLRQHRPEAPPADPALLNQILTQLPARRSPRPWPGLVAAVAVLAALGGGWYLQRAEQYALEHYILAVWQTEFAIVEWDLDER